MSTRSNPGGLAQAGFEQERSEKNVSFNAQTQQIAIAGDVSVKNSAKFSVGKIEYHQVKQSSEHKVVSKAQKQEQGQSAIGPKLRSQNEQLAPQTKVLHSAPIIKGNFREFMTEFDSQDDSDNSVRRPKYNPSGKSTPSE